MKKKQPKHPNQKIHAAFVKELKAFQRGGYKFDGTERALFPGTQQEAFDKYLTDFESGITQGYFEIPTGVGKTALFIAIIGCFLRATENFPEPPRVLIHVPTNDLVTQTSLSFVDFIPNIARVLEGEEDSGRRLDFANSQVHTKRQGAVSDARVVVTTYQGQAADEKRVQGAEDKTKAHAARVYKPEEFGLVIHDEAHSLTGEKLGPAAVDKFPDAIQLGVTATPEYSPTKTVANKLGHRYYDLPITTAMERGDLCGARPVLIKTKLSGNDRIKLEKAREFFEQQKGKSLSDAQLEQLYNQEARNKAIIKAYLTGTHPDTGERYLGKTGMIFAGGTTHCSDFVRHAEKVLNQTAYRDVKKWLREQGLTLIAPVHGKTPKDGVDILVNGKWRKCSEEEVKELHRQGKILLLISDQKLKVGSDFPADEFGADAVDRFSVVEAGQRTGRLLRRDRGDERYDRPPNPHKDAVLINVIDETTHEMYKGTPHHPIHAVEVLHGAKHRPAVRRIGGLTRFVPQVHEQGAEALGFEFETDVEVIREVSKEFEKGKKQPFPIKTKDNLTLSNELPRALRVDNFHPSYDAWRTKTESAIAAGKIVEVDGHRVQKMQSYHLNPLCLHRDAVPALAKLIGRVPDKTDEYLTLGSELPKALKTNVSNPIYSAWRSKAEADTANGKTVKIGGYSVQKMRSWSQEPYCLHANAIPALAKSLNIELLDELPTKTSEYLALGRELAKALHIDKRHPDYSAWQAETEKTILAGKLVKVGAYTVQQMKSVGQEPYCLHRDALPLLAKQLNIKSADNIPNKTDEYLALKVQLPLALKIDKANKKFLNWLKKIEAAVATGEIVEIDGCKVQRMRSRGHIPLCIHRNAIPALKEILANMHLETTTESEPQHATEDLKTKPIKPKDIKPARGNLRRTADVEPETDIYLQYANEWLKAKAIEPKDIKPKSDNLKRTGRVRGIAEEE